MRSFSTAARSSGVSGYSSPGFSRRMFSSRIRRNSGSVTRSGRCSATFVTRLRTERIPLVWIFVGSTRSASPTTERSESNIMVPWCITRP